MTVVLVLVYLVGLFATLYVVAPVAVQGPAGAWLYRACLLQPRSWALGLPFVVAAMAASALWPVVLVLWLLTGRRPPPLITTQALLDFYEVPDDGDRPVLSRIPQDVPRRLAGHRTTLPTEFPSSGDFWVLYLGRDQPGHPEEVADRG